MSPSALDRNRLGETSSPYLLDHAENPVHWQPWDSIALDGAKDRDQPIFLSSGYAACHWCHVMAEESFEDEAVADVLNRHFIPIKIDREERPDLDQFYQTAIQLTSGRGGWPLSAWVTPDGRPFQLATYIPKTAQHGRPGFVDLLEHLAEQWRNDRDTIESRADEITAAVRSNTQHEQAATRPDSVEDLVLSVANNVLRSIDFDHGGFASNGPKFPHASRLQLLLLAWQVTDRDAYRDALSITLDAMIEGGLHDHVDGGFHRYVTDPQWQVPHFEKMLYDNAMLLGVLSEAASRLDESTYELAARKTATFLQSSLQDRDGGFYSSLDADTAAGEGTTYVWSADEAASAIDEELTSSIVIDRFGIAGEPEVEGGRVLKVTRSIDELAATYDIDTDEVNQRLDDGLDQLQMARRKRPQPRVDTKVITAWNGLTISGFATAGVFLDEPAYLDVADQTISFIESTMYEPSSGQLYRRYRETSVGIDGFLEDYASMAVAAFDLYWATGSRNHARFGLALVDELVDRFWDRESRSIRFTQRTHQQAPVDTLDARDQSTPSPLAQTVDALATAHGLRGDERYEAVVTAIDGRYGSSSSASGVNSTALTMALDRWHQGPPSVTIVGADVPSSWRRTLQHHPRRLVLNHRPSGDSLEDAMDELGLSEIPPLWRDRTPVDGQPTMYACRGRTCGPPATDIESIHTWLE